MSAKNRVKIWADSGPSTGRGLADSAEVLDFDDDAFRITGPTRNPIPTWGR